MADRTCPTPWRSGAGRRMPMAASSDPLAGVSAPFRAGRGLVAGCAGSRPVGRAAGITRRGLAGALAAGLATPARASWMPARSVTIVSPYAPGGSSDALLRPLAERLEPLLGVPVVVENRPGAQTALAAEQVARAVPDGHRLLLSATATLTINPQLRRDLPYRVADFEPVAQLATLPYAIAVRQGMPAGLAEFVAHARARPGGVSMGSSGRGSGLHLAGALVAAELGLDFTEVTYRSDAPAVNDLMSGALDAAGLGGPPALAAARSGRVRVVGWTAAERLPGQPDQPVFAELAPGAVAIGWFGLHAPARTPPAALATLNRAVAAALAGADALRARLAAEGVLVPEVGPPAAFAGFLARETDRLAALLPRIGLLPEG